MPRKELIDHGFSQLIGETPDEGGHYFTVWAPRQCGKTWIMQEVIRLIRQTGQYDVAMTSVGLAREKTKEEDVMEIIIYQLQNAFGKPFPRLQKLSELPQLFTREYFQKPVILALDEFDALEEVFINRFANMFRELYIRRLGETDKASGEKTCLLHGLALIGVRSVLGIENKSGSPFNVQRSLRIPNLTFDEVESLFKWYEKERGQQVEPGVIQALFKEVNGQPGITSWFGEILTDGIEHYVNDRTHSINMRDFEIVYAAATYILPNNNILNLISKAKEELNKEVVLKLFQTDEKLEFKFDDKTLNTLYINGLVQYEIEDETRFYTKFSSSFVHKRLFNYFANEYFKDLGNLTESFTDDERVITPSGIDINEVMMLYRKYLGRNKHWLFKNAPRRSDQRIYEAIFHFNLYEYLSHLLRRFGADVFPEFPTGNGKIDLLVCWEQKKYGIELKSFTNKTSYKNALGKAAHYGKQLGFKDGGGAWFCANLNALFLILCLFLFFVSRRSCGIHL